MSSERDIGGFWSVLGAGLRVRVTAEPLRTRSTGRRSDKLYLVKKIGRAIR